MATRIPTIYTVAGGPLPKDYSVECWWCRFGVVTPQTRCWIPIPAKNIVHQTCATGARKIDKTGFFCQWPCALAFCFYREGMRRYMDQVRIEAGKHGFIGGIIPMAPDPLVTLKQCLPSLQGTRESTQVQYCKYIQRHIQVREVRNSEISSARMYALHSNVEPREAVHVLEHSSHSDPDLVEPDPCVETIVEGQPAARRGAYDEYRTGMTKSATRNTAKPTKPRKTPSKSFSSSSSSSSSSTSSTSSSTFPSMGMRGTTSAKFGSLF